MSGNNNGSGLDQRKPIPSIYPDFPWPPLTEVSEPDYIKTSTKGKAVLQSFYTVSIGLCVVVLDLIQATVCFSNVMPCFTHNWDLPESFCVIPFAKCQ